MTADQKSFCTAEEALARLKEGNERFISGQARFPTVQKEILLRCRGRHMKQRRTVVAFLMVMMAVGFGCVSEPGIDKGKFSESLRIARNLQTSLTRGDHCDVPAELLQKLASETEALKDKTASPAEKKVVKAISGLVSTYNDGVLLCKSRTRLTHFPFVPKGRIYVFQELDPLVQKYDLSTESHVYGPTGASWRSISWDSIEVIWESAGSRLKDIENAVNYS